MTKGISWLVKNNILLANDSLGFILNLLKLKIRNQINHKNIWKPNNLNYSLSQFLGRKYTKKVFLLRVTKWLNFICYPFIYRYIFKAAIIKKDCENWNIIHLKNIFNNTMFDESILIYSCAFFIFLAKFKNADLSLSG